MNASQTDERRFHDLVRDFVAETAGHGEKPEPGGMLEFGFGDFTARAFLASRAPGLLTVEVDLPSTISSDVTDRAELLLALHRMNDAARYEHGWIATVDDDALVVIHKLVALARTGPGEFRDLFDDGLDRAAALERMLGGLAEAEGEGDVAAVGLEGGTMVFRG